MAHPNSSLRILLIDDNKDHAKILQWAFQQSGENNVIQYFDDSQQALKYLDATPGDDGNRPDLIFLDFNLPRIDGREVLRVLKSGEATKSIPVIVLSSSEREEDVRKAYELGANSYLSKSVVLGDFHSALKTFQEYWSNIAKLPVRK